MRALHFSLNLFATKCFYNILIHVYEKVNFSNAWSYFYKSSFFLNL